MPVETRQKIEDNLSLTPEENLIAEKSPQSAAKLLSSIPRLEGVAQILHYHRKNFDGTGFPTDELKGTDLPLGSRILKVLFDYEKLNLSGLPMDKIFEEFFHKKGVYDQSILKHSIIALGNARKGLVKDSSFPALQALSDVLRSKEIHSELTTRT